MCLDRVSNRGNCKAAVDFKLFVRYVRESTTFTADRERDRGNRSTLRIVALPAIAVAAALAKVYLTEVRCRSLTPRRECRSRAKIAC